MATRWGIVSAGKISHDFVSSVRSLPQTEHQVVSVAARDLGRAKEFASRHHIPQAYGSYEELAKDKNVDIVYVGALNRDHFPIGKLMLESGKNVLMEKPMGMNLKQTKELISVAKKNDCFLMEAIWSRFFPVYKKLDEELSKKTIGDVVNVVLTHGFHGLKSDRVQKKELGGSGILDIGVYLVNMLSYIFKEKPLKLAAVGSLNEDGIDQNVGISFLYSGGRVATGSLSTVAELPNKVIITGTKGHIRVDNPYHCPTTLVTPHETFDFPLPDTVLPCNFTNSSGLRYEAMSVRECLKQGLKECPEMTHKDSELLAELMDEIRRQVGVIVPEDLA